MTVTINPKEEIKLTFFPSSLVQEVIQNVYCILQTPYCSVPCYREFGVKNEYLHRPINVAKSAFVSAIVEAIGEFEPRAQVNRVTFDVDVNDPGHLIPNVEVTISE